MNIFNISRLATCIFLSFSMSGWARSEAGGAIANPDAAQHIVRSSSYIPIVITGNNLPGLINVPVSRIRAYSLRNDSVATIPFQIDKRDLKGRYDLTSHTNNQNLFLDANDECVFMAADAGERIERLATYFAQQRVVEIGIIEPRTRERKWVYLVESKLGQSTFTESHHVSYNADRDSIETAFYRIGFSKPHPFLIDSLQWRDGTTQKWTRNVADTMKIRHSGKLLGQPFVRTQMDYRSRLVGVLQGPVRIIRRTLNTVRILGFLQSPSVSIDYIVFENGFQMDTTVDFPFPLGWFFSDIKTYTTLDWNDDPSLPVAQIYQTSHSNGLVINGKMTKEKELFNQVGGQQFAIQNAYGSIFTQLVIGKDFPIIANNFLLDARTQADPPENIPGQYGNVGFLSTNWEKVDTASHHLLFNVLLLQKASLDQGFQALEHFTERK